MKQLRDCLLKSCRILTVILVAGLLIGCASAVAPLDDATVTSLRPASPEDMARYEKAQSILAREYFAGGSFSDGKGNVLASFTADQYEEYQDYLSRHHPNLSAHLGSPFTGPSPSKIDWPVLRLSFKSDRNLYLEPDDGSSLNVQFSLCDTKADKRVLHGFGLPQLIWKDRFLTFRHASDVTRQQQSSEIVQEYEIFFRYVHYDFEGRTAGEPIELLPLDDDLCVALHRYNYPFASSLGRPLRITKEMVNDAAGPLPRRLAIPGK